MKLTTLSQLPFVLFSVLSVSVNARGSNFLSKTTSSIIKQEDNFSLAHNLPTFSSFQKKKNHSSLQHSPRGGADGPSEEAKSIATTTYYADLIWGGGTLVFLVLWIRSLLLFQKPNYPDEFPNFNKMVLKAGFCNAIDPSPWPPTQTLCGIVDLLLVIGSYFLLGDAVKTPEGGLKPAYLASIIYTLIHGATHYSVQINPDISTGPLWDPNNLAMSIIGTALMSVVMIFAPLLLYFLLETVNVSNALPIAGGYWAAVIAIFAIFLNDKAFALTYINVTIFLTIFGLRPFLIGKDTTEDIEKRVSMTPLSLPLFLVSTSFAIGIMCMEPLVCKSWFESIGGHVWFDIALFVMLTNSVYASY